MNQTSRFLLLLFVFGVAVVPVRVMALRSHGDRRANAVPLEAKIYIPDKISGGEKAEAKLDLSEASDQELTFKLESNNPGVVTIDPSEVKIPLGSSRAGFNLLTTATPIKTTVTISARTREGYLVQKSMEVVPAMIRTATMSASSMIGTHGARLSCRVELRAHAPSGGIELYLSPLKVSPSADRGTALQIQNPRVPAGQQSVAFDIEYDALRAAEIYEARNTSSSNTRVGDFDTGDFNLQTRNLEIVVALDPQSSGTWQTIPGIANKVSFSVVPLRVSSFAVQPTTVVGGNEALASFSLNAPPGNDEEARLSPARASGSKMWVVPVGSSCLSAAVQYQKSLVDLPLSQGATTHSFKVCTTSVSEINSGKVRVILRSGASETPLTIQPQ